MHASAVLQKYLPDVLRRMHAKRVQVLLGAVQALLLSRRLVLMELARAWPGAERIRAPLKRLDRLLSNRHLHSEQTALYAAMARRLIRGTQPLIVVDWSALKQDESLHVLRAGLVLQGRTLTLFEQVYPQRQLGSPAAHRRFLQGLKRILPGTVRPIVVTDAGFRCPWFRAVEALGWHFVGRVRNHVYVQLPGTSHWRFTRTLLAERRSRAFGTVCLAKHQPFTCQLLRYHRPRQARRRYRRALNDKAARGIREPWLLAYSRSLQTISVTRIAACYRQRMQIEQSFRDLKSGRYGCALRYSLTRGAQRISILLLLHALACFVAWLCGLAASGSHQILHCAVRTTSRSHYSLLRIGWERLRQTKPLSLPSHCFSLAFIPLAEL